MKPDMCSRERWISTSYAFFENLSEYMNIYLIRIKYETFEKISKTFKMKWKIIITRKSRFYDSIIKEDILVTKFSKTPKILGIVPNLHFLKHHKSMECSRYVMK